MLAKRRLSIVGPVALIVLGGVALLVESGVLSANSVWTWYARWWPVFLVAVGLLSLWEWWLDRAENGPVHRGYVAAVLLITVLAFGAFAERKIHGWAEGTPDIFFSQIFGRAYYADRSFSQAIPAHASVVIKAGRGDLTLTPSADGAVHISAHEAVNARSENQAQEAFAALTPQVIVQGSTVIVRENDPHAGRAEMRIELPLRKRLHHFVAGGLDHRRPYGAFEDLHGRGDLHLSNLSGGAYAQMGRGDFSAKRITGNLTLTGRAGSVSVADVHGEVFLDGRFSDAIDLAQIDAPVHFRTGRGSADFARMTGKILFNSDGMRVRNAAGPSRLSASGRDIVCTAMTGDLNVQDDNGDIFVSVAEPVGQVLIHDRNGTIHLSLPSTLLQRGGFDLQATARDGDVRSALSLPVQNVGEGQSIAGHVGGNGGPRIELIADHGNIEIGVEEAAAKPSAVSAVRRPVSAPSVSHLR